MKFMQIARVFPLKCRFLPTTCSTSPPRNFAELINRRGREAGGRISICNW